MAEAIARSLVGNLTYLAPAGPLVEAAACDDLGQAIAACGADHLLHLVLNLEQVSVLGGRALEIMLDTHTRLMQQGGFCKIANAMPRVCDILIATRMVDPEALVQSEFGELHSLGSYYVAPSPHKLGDILLEMGVVTMAQIDNIIRQQSRANDRIGTLLVDQGIITARDRLRALSHQLGVPYIALRSGLFETAAAQLLPREVARRLAVLPMFKVHDSLTLATNNPQDIAALDEVRELTRCKLNLVLAEGSDILKHQIDAYSGNELMPELVDNAATDIELIESEQVDFAQIDQMAGASPVINLVNGLIQRAVRDGASDIHIESTRTRTLVRFRIDGVLYEALSTRADLHPAIVSRLKVMANLDIAERRLPQDGRLQVITQGRNVDLRFSSLPGIHGEKVVLRILDKNQSILDVEKLGMSTRNLTLLKKLLGRSFGMILVTGPTGSGKTTTLYAAMNHLKSIEKNIVTIEDPVEYQIDIINQNQVNEGIGLDFARMLRHVLRQDPDIIMVGEIRDRETAEIAVQAALTGHLVLSTLHTNDAVGAISRLMDMGVEPYLLSSALAGVVAQRLVRGICPACRTTYLAAPELLQRHGWPEGTRLSRGRGCPSCYDTGYRSRMAIHEIIEATDALQRIIVGSPSKDVLAEFTRSEGYPTLFDDGLLRVREGQTTLEEVARVIHAE